jgi:hypothetical protein
MTMGMKRDGWARGLAVCIAMAAWLGLGAQFAVTYGATRGVLVALGTIFGYFTITTNLLVAVVFTCVAIRRESVRSWVIAGTALSILMVGVIYVLLLHGTVELSGGSSVANKLTHFVTPVLGPLFWILFVPKGELHWRHPLWWATYPLAYLLYEVAHGAETGRYAYPFLNVMVLGWERTAVNALLIAVGFMACGWAMVWVDGWFRRA